jgi:hypothetical protein
VVATIGLVRLVAALAVLEAERNAPDASVREDVEATQAQLAEVVAELRTGQLPVAALERGQRSA